MAASGCLDPVGIPRRLACDDGFDLHPPERFLEADDYVVTVTVSPRFGDSEPHACGFAHESQLGELAEIFGLEFGSMLQFSFDSFF